MIQKFKSFFRKKIGLPLWMFVLGGNPTTMSDEEYDQALGKISHSFMNGKAVICRIDGKMVQLSWVKNKVQLKYLTPDDVEWDGT